MRIKGGGKIFSKEAAMIEPFEADSISNGSFTMVIKRNKKEGVHS